MKILNQKIETKDGRYRREMFLLFVAEYMMYFAWKGWTSLSTITLARCCRSNCTHTCIYLRRKARTQPCEKRCMPPSFQEIFVSLITRFPADESAFHSNSRAFGFRYEAMAKDSNDRPPIFQSFDWEVKTKIENTWLTNLSDSYRNYQKDLEFVISFYFEAFVSNVIFSVITARITRTRKSFAMEMF